MGTTTTNLALYKPTRAERDWDALVNANFDTIDGRLAAPATGIQYVDQRGSNSNDGLTPQKAKKDVVAAYDALDTDGGRIRVISSVTGGDIPYWDFTNQTFGLWIVGPNDPRYASIPANGPDASGFRRQKPLVLEGWGGREFYSDAVGGTEPQTFIAGASATDPAKPAIWISGTSRPITFRGIRAVNLAQAVKLGLSTNDSTTNVNTANILFEGCYFSSYSSASAAATTEATVKTGYIFWVRFRDCTIGHAPIALTVSSVALVSGTTYTFTTATAHGFVARDVVNSLGNIPTGYNGVWTVVTVPTSTTFTADIGTNPAALSTPGTVRALLSDRQAAVLLQGDGGEANPGLVTIDNVQFASAGVRFKPEGATGWGAVVMRDCIVESDFVNHAPPVFAIARRPSADFYEISAGSGYIFLQNLSVADGTSPYGSVDLRYINNPSMVTTINCAEVQGAVQSAGGTNMAGLTDGNKVGMFQTDPQRVFGEHDGHKRAFHPTVARYANLAPYDETTWEAGSGTATVATGQAAPDGSSRAGQVTAVASPDSTRIYSAARTVNIGDYFIAGGWYKSGANGWDPVSSYVPYTLDFIGSTFKFDTHQIYSQRLIAGAQYSAGRTADGDWQFRVTAHKVMEGSGAPDVAMTMHVRSGFPFYFYAPILIHIPVADGLTYAEVREIRDGLCAYSNELDPGEVGTLRGQTANWVGGMKVGDGGKVNKVLTGSTTWDPASIADGDDLSTTLTVTGAAVGDPCFAGLTTLTTQDVQITAHVSAANTVKVVLLNRNGAAVDLASGTLKVTVFQNA